MTCYCGDIYCPSCGPAQGVDPVFAELVESLAEEVDGFMELEEANPDALHEALQRAWDRGFDSGKVEEQKDQQYRRLMGDQ